MKEKLLLIMNPVSGKLKGISHRESIVSLLSEKYDVTLMLTAKKGDGTLLAREHMNGFDAVAACGGDGTLNEVMTALLELPEEKRIPMLCIPAGTTNLLGDTIGLSKDVTETSKRMITAQPRTFDMGFFNDSCFCSVVSFGAFTDTSYSTPQKLKNALGYGAYVVGGVRSLFHLHNYPMTFKTDRETFEDRFIFGSVSNCRAVGGVIKFDDNVVDTSDGLYELVLVRKIHNPANLYRVAKAIMSKNYDECNEIIYRKINAVEITCPSPMPWTIDGEYKGDFQNVSVKVSEHALKLVY